MSVKVSVSELNTFLRCRRKYKYAYVDQLRPRKEALPLARGTIIHAALEAFYRDKDWTVPLRDAEASIKAKLFEEEQAPYMEIITDAYQIMRGYVHHVKVGLLDDFEIIDVERKFEVKLPNGHTYEGRIDLLVRDAVGLWPLDHKTVKEIPSDGVRFTDWQTTLYAWAVKELYGEEPVGVIFNYLRSKAPKVPELTIKGTMSKSAIDTDWATYEGALRKAGLNPAEYPEMRDKLSGKVFFKRERLPRPRKMTMEVVKEASLVAGMISNYLEHPTPETLFYPRTIDRGCDWGCQYRSLCHAELTGINPEFIRAEQYVAMGEVAATTEGAVDDDE